jgi:hypothetical protein
LPAAVTVHDVDLRVTRWLLGGPIFSSNASIVSSSSVVSLARLAGSTNGGRAATLHVKRLHRLAPAPIGQEPRRLQAIPRSLAIVKHHAQHEISDNGAVVPHKFTHTTRQTPRAATRITALPGHETTPGDAASTRCYRTVLNGDHRYSSIAASAVVTYRSVFAASESTLAQRAVL